MENDLLDESDVPPNWPAQVTGMTSTDLRQYLNSLTPAVDERILDQFYTALRHHAPGSRARSLQGLFVVRAEDVKAGVVANISLDNVELLKRPGRDQIRVATHIVDERDILADQARMISEYLRTACEIKESHRLRLEYGIDQPTSLLVGNSIGVPFGFLGEIGMKGANRRFGLQPKIYQDIGFTGALDATGRVESLRHSDIKQKIEAAFYGPLRGIVVPHGNYNSARKSLERLRERYPARELTLISLNHLQELHGRPETLHYQRPSLRENFRHIIRDYLSQVSTGVFFFFLAVLITAGIFIVGDKRPVKLIPDGEQIVVKNRFGIPLWKSASFETSLHQGDVRRRTAMIDLRGDERIEILIGYNAEASKECRGSVVCYDHNGVVLWNRDIGTPVRYGDNIYSDFFRVDQMKIIDYNADGKSEIVVIGNQGFFPHRLLILDPNGEIISDYWHAGSLTVIETADLYPDNNSIELILGGTNVEYGSGMLAVLDPHILSGASPQQKRHYVHQTAEPGNEIYYMRFPSTHFQSPFHKDLISDIKISDDNKIEVTLHNSVNGRFEMVDPAMEATVTYVLGDSCRPEFVAPDDSYYRLYEQLNRGGAPLPYNDEKVLRHFRELLYWDGSHWQQKPTINRLYLKTMRENNLNKVSP